MFVVCGRASHVMFMKACFLESVRVALCLVSVSYSIGTEASSPCSLRPLRNGIEKANDPEHA